MAIQNDFPLFDGIAPSWADLSIKVKSAGAQQLTSKDVKAINTASTVEIGEQQGTSGGRVMMRTSGAQKLEGSWTLYHTGWHKILRSILIPTAEAKGFKRGNQLLVSLVVFDLTYQWSPPGGPEIFETRLLGCRTIGRTINGAEGTDATVVELPLSIAQIVDIVDGKEIVLL